MPPFHLARTDLIPKSLAATATSQHEVTGEDVQLLV